MKKTRFICFKEILMILMGLVVAEVTMAQQSPTYLHLRQTFVDATVPGSSALPIGVSLTCSIALPSVMQLQRTENYLNLGRSGELLSNGGVAPIRSLSYQNVASPADAGASDRPLLTAEVDSVKYYFRSDAAGHILIEMTGAERGVNGDESIANPSRFVQSYILCSQPLPASPVPPVPSFTPALPPNIGPSVEPALPPPPAQQATPPPTPPEPEYSCRVKCGGFNDVLRTSFAYHSWPSHGPSLDDAFNAAAGACGDEARTRGHLYFDGLRTFHEVIRDRRGRVVRFIDASPDRDCYCNRYCR